MNATTCPTDQVFQTAARCADCPNPACAQACPEQVDLRAIIEFVAAQAPMPLSWIRGDNEADAFAGEAIHHSFE